MEIIGIVGLGEQAVVDSATGAFQHILFGLPDVSGPPMRMPDGSVWFSGNNSRLYARPYVSYPPDPNWTVSYSSFPTSNNGVSFATNGAFCYDHATKWVRVYNPRASFDEELASFDMATRVHVERRSGRPWYSAGIRRLRMSKDGAYFYLEGGSWDPVDLNDSYADIGVIWPQVADPATGHMVTLEQLSFEVHPDTGELWWLAQSLDSTVANQPQRRWFVRQAPTFINQTLSIVNNPYGPWYVADAVLVETTPVAEYATPRLVDYRFNSLVLDAETSTIYYLGRTDELSFPGYALPRGELVQSYNAVSHVYTEDAFPDSLNQYNAVRSSLGYASVVDRPQFHYIGGPALLPVQRFVGWSVGSIRMDDAPIAVQSTPGTVAPMFVVAATKQTTGGTLNITIPIEVHPGDLLILFLAFPTGTGAYATQPGGWSSFGTDGVAYGLGSNNMRSQMYYKFATADDCGGAVPTQSSYVGFRTSAILMAYRGAFISNPVNVIASQASSGNGTTATAPSVTTTENACVLVRLFAEVEPSGNPSLAGPVTVRASGWTNGNYVGTTVSDQTLTAVGSTGIASAVIASGSWTATTLAINPAAN